MDHSDLSKGLALVGFAPSALTFCMTASSTGGADYSQRDATEETRFFLAMNLEELQEQAAQGGGPHLAELARLMGTSERGLASELVLRLGE